MSPAPILPDLNQNWTLNQPVTLQGIGLHTGLSTAIEIHPKQTPGYDFHLGTEVIPARPEYVFKTQFCTSLKKDHLEISTIEHLLAALGGLGITAAEIRLTHPECPILDGSAAPYVTHILNAGIVPISSTRIWLTPSKTLTILDRHASLTLTPASEFIIDYTVEYPGQLHQNLRWKWSPEAFIYEISPARTFAFERDLEALRQAGFIKGGSLDCALVLTEKGSLTPPRFADECVRHKILDLLGDFALMGAYPQGLLTVSRGGHTAHVKMIRRLQQTVLTG